MITAKAVDQDRHQMNVAELDLPNFAEQSHDQIIDLEVNDIWLNRVQ